MKIEDSYAAYCFNEAITEFIMHLQKKEKPRFIADKKERKQKNYNPGLKMLLG